MSTRRSFRSERDPPDERDSGKAYESVAPDDDHGAFDSDGNLKTRTRLRSGSMSTLIQRVRTAGSWTVPIMLLGAYIAAAAFIVVHHVFFTVLDGKSVQDFVVPQTWVRDIGNALASVIQIALQTSVGVALTQSVSTCYDLYMPGF